MMRPNPARRFFPKEVAFLFGLFVLNAVLMFVVGLSVGKTWVPRSRVKPPPTQAALGGAQPPVASWTPDKWKDQVSRQGGASDTHQVSRQGGVTTGGEIVPKVAVAPKAPNAPATAELKPGTPLTQAAPVVPSEKNRIADIISFPKGLFTVQVGSYLSEPEANERIDELKKLGFPHAYFSAKELGDPKMVWYRVWLGYFSTPESARKGGEWLQRRGEVKSYLVRKHDPNG